MRSITAFALSTVLVLAASTLTPDALGRRQDDFATPRLIVPSGRPDGALTTYGSRAFTHAGSIGAAAFTPDGTRIMSGGFDRTLRLWDARTGDELQRIVDLFGYAIGGITFCPDPRYVLVSDGANAFGRFDLQEMKPVFRAIAAVDFFAVSADATRIAAFGPASNGIHVHDALTDGRLLRSFPIEKGVARSAAWNPDGKSLAYGRQTKKGHMKYDGAIVFTSMDEEPDVVELPVPDVLFASMTFSPDGTKLIGGATDGSIYVVDTVAKTIITTKKVHEAVVIALRFSPDGKTLAVGSNDAHLSLVDASTFEVVQSIQAHATGVRSIGYSPDGKTIVTGSFDSTLGLWNAETLESTFEAHGHQRPVSCAIEVDADTLVTASYGGDVIVWSKGMQERRTKVMGGFVFQLAYAPQTRTLAAVGQDTFVALWSDAGRGEMRRIEGGEVASLAGAFSQDGTRLAVSFADGTVRVIRVEDGTELYRVTHESKFVQGVVWGPGDQELWTAASTLFCWSGADGKPLRTIESPRAPIQSLKLSPDGHLLAVASADSRVHLYDRASGDEVRAMVAAQGRVKDVAFSPDGRWLVSSAESENDVAIWNVADGSRVNTLTGHEAPTLGLSFSPDGSRLFTSSIDGVTIAWDTGRVTKPR
ncbi:MAG: hypothetical protein IPH13_03650 [Planctomycetes bacterium]|nr:hypothetical protein [Planctomycetota bacterium]MCC7173307.1 hypothetical protein [Planctomycetota bacterium]